MRALRIIDDTGALFPPRPVEFRCSEIGLETFGWNVENDRMADALAARAAATGGSRARLKSPSRPTTSPASGRSRGSRTDARSPPRSGRRRGRARFAGAPRRRPRRPRPPLSAERADRVPVATACPIATSRPNFTPARDPSPWCRCRRAPRAADRSSLVWVMSDAEAQPARGARRFGARRRDRAAKPARCSGAMRLEGRRGLFPMVRQVVPQARRRPARPRRRRGPRLPADRRAGAEPRPARRRGDRRDRGRGARRRAATSAAAEALEAYERARRADILDPHRRGRRPQPGAARPLRLRSTSPAARAWRRSARSARSGALSCARGSRPVSAAPDGDLGRGISRMKFPAFPDYQGIFLEEGAGKGAAPC